MTAIPAGWTDASIAPPMPDESSGYLRESVKLLVLDKQGEHHLATCSQYLDPDMGEGIRWTLDGPDGWDIEPVAYRSIIVPGETELAQASQAWRALLSAEKTINRLRSFKALSRAMRADLDLALNHEREARAQINAILNRRAP